MGAIAFFVGLTVGILGTTLYFWLARYCEPKPNPPAKDADDWWKRGEPAPY